MAGIYTYLRCIYFARDVVDLESACHRDYPQYVQVGGEQICKYTKYKTKIKESSGGYRTNTSLEGSILKRDDSDM